MRLERSKFVELCFHKTPSNNVVGYYKHKNSKYYWFEGYSVIHNDIKFWI